MAASRLGLYGDDNFSVPELTKMRIDSQGI